ncbi:MAG: outer membrane beta-barrel protein [Rikenellaceae bacterium]
MKLKNKLHILLLLLIATISYLPSFAQNIKKTEISGLILDENSNPVSYSTIVCRNSADSSSVFGTISDNEGNFALSVPVGEYDFSVNYIGYENIDKKIELSESKFDLGTITLKEDAMQIEEVMVKGNGVVRKSDRYIVSLKDNPVTKGKSAYETLRYAPGVLTNDGITVNGRGGTLLYINNRLQNMTEDEIESYLGSLNGEDVEKIEVIPIAGAEYDASAKGGVIRITLSSQRDSGYSGTISTSEEINGDGLTNSTNSANLSYHKNRLSLYSNFSYSYINLNSKLTEITEYKEPSNIINSNSTEISSKIGNFNGEINSVYDISDKQSIGAVIRLNTHNSENKTIGNSSRIVDDFETLYNSSQSNPAKDNTIFATVDYNLQLDTLGSSFRASADYKYNDSNGETNFVSLYAEPVDGESDISEIFYNTFDNYSYLASFNGDFNIYLSPKSNLKSGLKLFTMNNTNNMVYKSLEDGELVVDTDQTDLLKYSENVAAIYSTYAYSGEGWGFSFGLRGEYTFLDIDSQNDDTDHSDNYFNLFPNASFMYSINSQKGHSISLNANQKFTRPSLSQLRPYVTPTSEYSFSIGNPELLPTIYSNISLSQTLWHKYSITADYTYKKNQIYQMIITKEEDPGVLYYQQQNIESESSFSLNLFAPITFTKWLTVMVNGQIANIEQQYQNSNMEIVSDRNTTYTAYASAMITLPKGFNLNVDGYQTSVLHQANYTINAQNALNVSLNKSILNNRLNVTLRGNKLIYSKIDITTSDPNYENFANNFIPFRNFGISLRYNFSGGINKNIKKASSSSEYSDRI